MPNWDKVDVPAGNYISWEKKGQQVTMKVLAFDPVGGTDFNEQVCPLLTGYLVEDCTNYRDKGATKETLEAGEMVMITAGQANLKKGLLIADPKRDDLVRLTFSDTYKATKGTGKIIDVEIAKGAAAGNGDVDDDDEDDDL